MAVDASMVDAIEVVGVIVVVPLKDVIEVIGMVVAASLVDVAEVVVAVSLVRSTIAEKTAVISLVDTIEGVGVISLTDAITVVAKSLRHLI